MVDSVVFSSKFEEWSTPQVLFNQLDKCFNFTLDPCATSENAKCVNFYTKETDGLTQDWGGQVVFCNPPYGRHNTGIWIEKCFRESLKPNTTVVGLVPARTDTKWFHKYCRNNADIFFIKGRLKFGGSKNSAPFPSMILVFGERGFMHRNYLATLMKEVVIDDLTNPVVTIFYFHDGNRFVDVYGDVVHNIYEILTPNDVYLFRSDPDQREFRHRSFRGVTVNIIDMEDNGYEEGRIDFRYRACSRRDCRFSNLQDEARKEICCACGGEYPE